METLSDLQAAKKTGFSFLHGGKLLPRKEPESPDDHLHKHIQMDHVSVRGEAKQSPARSAYLRLDHKEFAGGWQPKRSM